jgi:NMD protein affecting ribosome stability and mRNA decay
MGTKQGQPDPSKGHRPRTGHAQPRDAHGVHKPAGKALDALVCERCKAVFHGGRWHWGAPPLGDVRSGLCPACERIRDRRPAGTIRLHQDLLAHEEEIRNLVANTEEAERDEHPLERVLAIEHSEDGMVVTTTGVHIARRIASKLKRRFHKKGTTSYPESEAIIFVDLED